MAIDEVEEPVEDSGGRPLTRRTLAVLVAVALVLAVALPTVVFFVFFTEREEPFMTVSQLYDDWTDTDGDDWPDDFASFNEGDNVTVRDRIVELSHSGFSGSAYIHFPYTGKKWNDLFGELGWVSLFAESNGSLCSYGPGDLMTLNGTLEVYEWDGERAEIFSWTIVGDPGPYEIPSVDLNVTHGGPETWKMEVSGCSAHCKLNHYKVMLKRYGFGWDLLEGLEHGKRSNLLEFWDMDRDGCLSEGDVLYAMPEEEGDYEVMLQYENEELDSVSFHYGGP